MRNRDADVLKAALKAIAGCSHHAHWLPAVNFRIDPLNQKLVDAVIDHVAENIQRLIDRPELLDARIAG